MSKSCVLFPKKGANLFKRLKQNFGHKNAAVLYNNLFNSKFQNANKDTLIFDSEGIPTYNSVMNTKAVQEYLGAEAIVNAYKKDQEVYEDSIDNAVMLVQRAHDFNQKNKNLTAVVTYNGDGDLQLEITPRNSLQDSVATNQYNILQLNQRIVKILSKAGITLSHLSKTDVLAGRVGLTDFNRAQDIANNFIGLIQIANNLEGTAVLSEEFSHLIIGIYRDRPLVQRTINFLKNETNARKVLGDEYDKVSEYYNGEEDLIAEEAAGKILRDKLLNPEKYKESLFTRMVNFIVNLFKGISISSYKDAINVDKDVSQLAKEILSSDFTLSKEDIAKSKRKATFNALSERAKVQMDVLKKGVDRLVKAAALSTDLESLKDDIQHSQELREYVGKLRGVIKRSTKKEETVAAIHAFLEQAIANIDSLNNKILDIEELSTQEKFTVLRNCLFNIEAYDKTIDELLKVTSKEYLNDEDISKQEFLQEDTNSSIAMREFEAVEDVQQIDTSDKSPEQIAKLMIKESKKFKLSKDESSYVNSETNEPGLRVTQVIQSDRNAGESMDPNNPHAIPSSNIGTGMDELTRDFFSDRIKPTGDFIEILDDEGKKTYPTFTVNGKKLSEVYPNCTELALCKFVESLQKFKKELEEKGITIIPRDIVAEGTVSVKDANGIEHKVRVVGTLDLIGYDKQGNWHVYDMKTYRSSMGQSKKQKYERQLTLYSQFLEHKYGIKVASLNIIPIKISYPNPENAEYTVSENRPKEYNGVNSNQLLINGKPFKSANPTLQNLMKVSSRKVNLSYKKLYNDPTEGRGSARQLILDTLADVIRLRSEFKKNFEEVAKQEFIKFLKPFIGDSIKVKNEKDNLVEVPIEDALIKASSDTSLMSHLFSSMADSPDVVLNIYDYVVKQQKYNHNLNTIEESQKIIALGKKYEALGITSYDWMFEEDKANYIIHRIDQNGRDISYDKSAYLKAKKEFQEYLDEKYKNTDSLSLDILEKQQELIQWVKDNTEEVTFDNGTTETIPLHTKYPSKYNSLSQTQKDFYNEWMEIKSNLDSLLGPGKTTLTSTIKIRKTGIERLKGSLNGEAITNFVNSVRAKFLKSFDDDVNYTINTIKGFHDEEIMKLPLFYVKNNGDNSDLSTDVIGTLIAYADMSYMYEALNEVVNPLEIGKEIILNNRRITETRGGKQLVDKFRSGKETVEEPVYVSAKSSQFAKTLQEFMDSKIYHRYFKDVGDIKGADKNKVVGTLLKLGSTVQLGFNGFAQLANALTGLSMQNIEAIAGEYFNVTELFNADKEFTKALMDYIGDIGQRTTHSKLKLFVEMFDVKLDYSNRPKNINFLNKTILGRIFGPRIQYLGQDGGDFWLYSRTAIAMALRKKVLLNGEEISFWEALETQPIDPEHPEYGNKLVLKEGVTNIDGTEINRADFFKFKSNIANINKHLFGIYNEEDSINARRVIWGRFLMQYRDWIPTAFIYRAASKRFSLEGGREMEGYYRTLGRFMKDCAMELKNGGMTIPQVWHELSKHEKRNIVRCITELTQYGIIALILPLLFGKGGDRDKKRNWLKNFTSYMVTREKTELGALTPFGVIPEGYKILKSPFANTSVISDVMNLSTLMWPWNYTDEIQGGDYKGHSSAYRAFMRSPLTLWYRTIKRQLNPERAEQYYKQ